MKKAKNKKVVKLPVKVKARKVKTNSRACF